MTRRRLLRQSLLCGSAVVSGFDYIRFPKSLVEQAALHPTANARGGSSMLGVVPFSDEGHPPMGETIGTELDGRLFTDLSTLTPENPVTATDKFFIRTRASKLLDASKPWTIHVAGLVEKPISILAEALAKKARPMGVHLMECSGNTRSAHFGMMSIAAWDGVPLEELLQMVKPKVSAFRVAVSGFDHYKEESMTSEPGASWILTPDQLFSSKAFLATKMNGQPLSEDHGAPVRLMVPGWYGCVCVKWVNQIELVSEDAPATSQMLEYASRTMQAGVPALARDYRPAIIDPAAMATRIEKRLVGGRIQYRIAGIQWGGIVPAEAVEIRFDPADRFLPVENLPSAPGNNWHFWRYEWSPPGTGKFTIRLRLNAPGIAARRLDSGYYDRAVDIAEI
jgi:DMSO/TMAO reductase YedYZ molybdopterin-dependent catalytic subunit